MKIKLDEGAFMPTRAHDTDADLDLYAREDKDKGVDVPETENKQ